MNQFTYAPNTPKWCILCEQPLTLHSFIFFHVVDGKIVECFHEDCYAKHDPEIAQRMRS